MPTSTDPLAFDQFASDLLSIDSFSYKLKFVAHVAASEVDITSSVLTANIWFGETASAVYGWTINMSGKGYDRYVYAAGNQVDVYRTISIASSYGWTPTEDLWYTGYFAPGSIEAAYDTDRWSATVIDRLSFYAKRRSPIIAIGEINVANNAGVTADSEATPEIVANQQEFIGQPSLSADRAVDNDLASLWISTNAPAKGSIASSVFSLPRVSEVYSRPNSSLSMKENQWIELCKNYGSDTQWISIMTRFGMIRLNISFGTPVDGAPSPKPSFAVISYDADTFGSIWGGAPSDCPHFETKNASWSGQYWTTEDPRNFGFNLDRQGDYIALGGGDYGPGGRGAHEWHTNLVVDGPKMQRDDVGLVVSLGGGDDDLTVDLDTAWDLNELEGCFVTCNFGASPLQNHVRHISGNTASTSAAGGKWRTTLYLSQIWRAYDGTWDYQPVAGHTVIIRSYPATSDSFNWTSGAVAEQAILSSLRLSSYLPNLGAAGWIADATPQVGYSGANPDVATWSWIKIEPQDMAFYLSAPLAAGATTVYLSGTIGMLSSGNVFVGLSGPLAYTGKTDETITLTSAWAGSTMPIGTQVYQSIGGSASTSWPISEVAVVRKQVPRLDNPALNRVISSIKVYGSNEVSPLLPGEDDGWGLDWDTLFTTDNNNTLTRLSWSVATAIRYKHYLFCIKSMSDESQGRINEIELLMPDSVLGAVLSNQTAASFFTYILTVMGFLESDITVTSGQYHQLGSFSTDSSSYAAVLSDLAVRTGYIVICTPLSKILVTKNPNWNAAGTLVPLATLPKTHIQKIDVEQRDDLSISQVQVTIQDYLGNVATGMFPPIPRSAGEIYQEPQVFSASIANADNIARWVLSERTSTLLNVKITGPAPWAIGGNQVVDLQWDYDYGVYGPEIQGLYVIRGTEHSLRFGSQVSPAMWETSLSLQRKV